MRLLHISASPRSSASESLAIAGEFLDAYRRANPGAEIDHFDLWDGTLPAFGPEAAAAKMAVFGGAAPEGRRGPRRSGRSSASTPTTATCSASRCGTPACRTSSSSSSTSSASPAWSSASTRRRLHPAAEGQEGRRRLHQRGLGPGLPPGFGDDFQSPFFDGWLRWAGITDIADIRYHPTVTGDADLERKRA
nr:NAD(P)H-dependent oxidoreductase [Planobispora longispora]